MVFFCLGRERESSSSYPADVSIACCRGVAWRGSTAAEEERGGDWPGNELPGSTRGDDNGQIVAVRSVWWWWWCVARAGGREGFLGAEGGTELLADRRRARVSQGQPGRLS